MAAYNLHTFHPEPYKIYPGLYYTRELASERKIKKKKNETTLPSFIGGSSSFRLLALTRPPHGCSCSLLRVCLWSSCFKRARALTINTNRVIIWKNVSLWNIVVSRELLPPWNCDTFRFSNQIYLDVYFCETVSCEFIFISYCRFHENLYFWLKRNDSHLLLIVVNKIKRINFHIFHLLI